MVAQSNKLIRLLTGRALTKGENRYTEKIIDKNKERMYKIVKSFNKNIHNIEALTEYFKILDYTVKGMLEILRQEREVAKQQKELGKELKSKRVLLILSLFINPLFIIPIPAEYTIVVVIIILLTPFFKLRKLFPTFFHPRLFVIYVSK